MIVGVTGHRKLRDHLAWDWVRGQLSAFLVGLPGPVVGLSSLAIGADQIFAEVVVELGGQIEAIIPFVGYERTFEADCDQSNFNKLVNLCARVETLGPSPTKEEAYLRAGQTVVDRSELMVAVWDGEAAHGLGGTADIVKYALFKGKPLVELNPTTRSVLVGKGAT